MAENEIKELDLSMDDSQLDCSIIDEEVVINPEEDAYSYAPPIPDGQHKFKLMLDNVQERQSEKSGKKYLMCNVVGTCVDKEHEGLKVFDSPTTLIPTGKNINPIAGMLKELGVTIPKQVKSIQLVRMLKDALANEPILEGITQWQAYSKNQKKNLATGMVNFPKMENGSYNHTINVKGEEVNATAKVKRWIGPKNPAWGFKGSVSSSSSFSSSGVSPVVAPKPVEKEEVVPELEV